MSRNTKTVMYVVHSLEIGGLEKCVVDLVNGIDRNRFEPIICCLASSGPAADKIWRNNIQIFEMKKRSGNDILLPFRLALLFRKKKVAIVHSGNWGTMFEAYVGSKIAGVPTIIHMEQGMELDDLERLPRYKRFLRGLTKRVCSLGIKKIVTVSSDLKEYVHRTTQIRKSKIEVIHNSVDTQRYARQQSQRAKVRAQFGLKSNDILIGSVGRLAEVKSYSTLIKAMQTVVSTCPRTRLFIVGDGPLRKQLQSQIHELALEKCVVLLGQRGDIPELLGAMDIYVLPSIFEGISISILEAMAAGLPVVATNVGGNPEILLNGKTGYLVEPRNPHAIADKLITLSQNEQIRGMFSREAVKKVNEVFHSRVMVSAYSRLYD